jgi:hypothetical protein
MSALCQKRTHAVQQIAYFIILISPLPDQQQRVD